MAALLVTCAIEIRVSLKTRPHVGDSLLVASRLIRHLLVKVRMRLLHWAHKLTSCIQIITVIVGLICLNVNFVFSLITSSDLATIYELEIFNTLYNCALLLRFHSSLWLIHLLLLILSGCWVWSPRLLFPLELLSWMTAISVLVFDQELELLSWKRVLRSVSDLWQHTGLRPILNLSRLCRLRCIGEVIVFSVKYFGDSTTCLT
jgi:hypothetical protein